MKYFCISHFFDPNEANSRFEQLIEEHHLENDGNENFLKHASRNEFWAALTKTSDTITLTADIQSSSEDFFTVIEYDYASTFIGNEYGNEFSFEVQKILPNRFKLSFRKEDEEKYTGFVRKVRDFSHFTFLIQRSNERYAEAFKEVIKVDTEITESNWRIPENFGEEFLVKLENRLDLCGKNYSKMVANYNLALTHLENIKLIELNIDISPVQRIIDEMRFKLMNSKVIYERLKDMKDIAIGSLEVRNMKSSMQLQKELLGLHKHSITIQNASIVIEAFIVYAYTITVWKSVNEEGFKHASLVMKYMIPLFITMGVVLFVEFAKNFKIGFLERKSLIYFIFSLILLVSGLILMNIQDFILI